MEQLAKKLEEMRIISDCDFVYAGINIYNQISIKFYKDKEVFEKKFTYKELSNFSENIKIYKLISLEAKDYFKDKLGKFDELHTPMLIKIGFVFPKKY